MVNQIFRSLLIAASIVVLSSCGGATVTEVPVDRGVSSTDYCHVFWSSESAYDTGNRPSIAINQRGYFIEEHKSESAGKLWYHIGQFNIGGILWGSSFNYDSGYDPSVSMDSHGLLVDVHANSSQHTLNPKLYYRIGRINLGQPPTTQQIQWLSGPTPFDGGYQPSVALSDSGTVVEVHESSSFPDNLELNYRVGHIVNKAGTYSIAWDSGQHGVTYDHGREPHIAIDSVNQVVEVHSSGFSLYYRRGHVSGGSIIFTVPAPNGRYITGTAEYPAVAIADHGFFLETHTVVQSKTIQAVYGSYDVSNPSVINFGFPNENLSASGASYSAVATNLSHALEVHAVGSSLRYSSGTLSCNASG